MEGQLEEDVVVSNNVTAGALDLKLSESGHSEKATEGKILMKYFHRLTLKQLSKNDDIYVCDFCLIILRADWTTDCNIILSFRR